MRLQGRVALVTGGAKRVGRVIAETLAQRQAHVVITYQTSAAEADEAVQQLTRHGVQAEAFRADQSKAADVRRLMERIQKRFGRLDVLVNNASIFERTPLDALDEAQWDRHLDVNLKGPFLCALHGGRMMRAGQGGVIVNIADWAGERPYADYLPYCVSKAGVIGLTKALAKELAPKIRVVAIAPGPVLPPPDMTSAERQRAVRRVPLQRWGTPQDVANAVLFAIEGSDFITGSMIYVDGGRSVA
jgi:NAD(P)-dependent dehydrogenase (short-subunit alcohol dehydrogenase family)